MLMTGASTVPMTGAALAKRSVVDCPSSTVPFVGMATTVTSYITPSASLLRGMFVLV